MKEKGIVKRLRDKFSKGKTRYGETKSLPEEEIKKQAKEVSDSHIWTKSMLESARISAPKKKVLVNIYFDKDIVDWFKLGGKGYQTRINSVLKAYVHKQIQKNH